MWPLGPVCVHCVELHHFSSLRRRLAGSQERTNERTNEEAKVFVVVADESRVLARICNWPAGWSLWMERLDPLPLPRAINRSVGAASRVVCTHLLLSSFAECVGRASRQAGKRSGLVRPARWLDGRRPGGRAALRYRTTSRLRPASKCKRAFSSSVRTCCSLARSPPPSSSFSLTCWH